MALWVSNGVAMVAAIGLTVVVEWRKIVFFSFEIFATDRLGRVGLTHPNPNPDFRMKMG